MENNIFWFNVTMDNLIGMQLIDCLTDLPHDRSNPRFRHGLQFFKLFKKLATHSQLKDKIDINSIIKEPIHSHYIRMIQVNLYF